MVQSGVRKIKKVRSLKWQVVILLLLAWRVDMQQLCLSWRVTRIRLISVSSELDGFKALLMEHEDLDLALAKARCTVWTKSIVF